MGLFGFGKKKDEAAAACTCAGEGTSQVIQGEAPCCCGCEEGLCHIKVLGAGCKNCHTMYENTLEAVKAMNLNSKVDYVTDMAVVASYGVMSMPALVVSEKVVSMGKVLSAKDVEQLLRELGC